MEDLDYGKRNIMAVIHDFRFISIFFTPDQTITEHPFVGFFQLWAERRDLLTELLREKPASRSLWTRFVGSLDGISGPTNEDAGCQHAVEANRLSVILSFMVLVNSV